MNNFGIAVNSERMKEKVEYGKSSLFLCHLHCLTKSYSIYNNNINRLGNNICVWFWLESMCFSRGVADMWCIYIKWHGRLPCCPERSICTHLQRAVYPPLPRYLLWRCLVIYLPAHHISHRKKRRWSIKGEKMERKKEGGRETVEDRWWDRQERREKRQWRRKSVQAMITYWWWEEQVERHIQSSFMTGRGNDGPVERREEKITTTQLRFFPCSMCHALTSNQEVWFGEIKIHWK